MITKEIIMYKDLFTIKTNKEEFWTLLEETFGTKRVNLFDNFTEEELDKGWAWDGTNISDETNCLTFQFDDVIRTEEDKDMPTNTRAPKSYYLRSIYFWVNDEKQRSNYAEGSVPDDITLTFKGTLPLGITLEDNKAEQIKAKLGEPMREFKFLNSTETRVVVYQDEEIEKILYKFHFDPDTNLLRTFEMTYR